MIGREEMSESVIGCHCKISWMTRAVVAAWKNTWNSHSVHDTSNEIFCKHPQGKKLIASWNVSCSGGIRAGEASVHTTLSRAGQSPNNRSSQLFTSGLHDIDEQMFLRLCIWSLGFGSKRNGSMVSSSNNKSK
jgi:hypothetical protein